MITINTTVKMTDRSVVSTCLLGARLNGTGLSGAVFGNEVFGIERPTKASAVAAAQASAYAVSLAAADAGAGRQKTQHHPMWAFRGPDPWRDPA